jgi:hypothetical protein
MWKQVKVGDMLKAGDRIRRRIPGGIVATDVTVTAGSTRVGYIQDGGFGLCNGNYATNYEVEVVYTHAKVDGVVKRIERITPGGAYLIDGEYYAPECVEACEAPAPPAIPNTAGEL